MGEVVQLKKRENVIKVRLKPDLCGEAWQHFVYVSKLACELTPTQTQILIDVLTESISGFTKEQLTPLTFEDLR